MIYKAVALLVLLIFIYLVWKKYFMDPWNEVSKMGHMKYWWIFGFEWWGAMRPDTMQRKNGDVYKSLFLGIWVKTKDKKLVDRFDKRDK